MRPGDVLAGRFEIERLAGRGGMGEVYRAHDRLEGGAVALKVLHAAEPSHAERFLREARVLAELHHPGVVRYVAHGPASGSDAFLAMEWLEGETLSERLAREGLTMGESLALARRVAEALSEAHRRGIVHRDLKPGNLFLPDRCVDRVKVLDFGIARVAGGDVPLTRTGAMLGTPGYMAPEQARGERDIDPRADVFALGCILFKCLTGRPAFIGDDPMAVLLRIVLEEAPRIRALVPAVPVAVDELVARMLAKSPADRPGDAGVVAKELAALGSLDGLEVARSSTPAAALTATEQRAMTLVLARLRAGQPHIAESNAETLPSDGGGATLESLRTLAGDAGERTDALVDGTVVVTIAPRGTATDQATRAARWALAIRSRAPGAAVAIVSGRAVDTGTMPLGELIDRGAHMLLGPIAQGVRIDEVSAGLLDARFELDGDELGLTLRGERDLGEGVRTLMGRPSSCVGREREIAAVEAFFVECVDEPMARPVLVTAAAGVGKSRLRYEVVRRLQARTGDVEVWIARGDPMGAGSPFGLLAPALRRTAGVRAGEPLAVRRQKLRARVARHVRPSEVQRVSEFLGELVGVPFDERASVQLRAAHQDPQLMGDQLRRAWEDMLSAECAAHPVLLVLEDLHWGDLPTVQLVDASLRALRERPFMVLALARPEVHELFPKLWSEREIQEIRLGALNRRGVERLVREVLGEATTDVDVERLFQRSGGNAFYLEELIRAVAEGRGHVLPETVLAMAQARLERLDSAARRILRAASVFGQIFWRSGIVALLGEGDTARELDDWLAVLTADEVVTRRAEGRFRAEAEYVFRHALMREAAYAMLTDADRTLGHRLAGAWLERVGETDAMVLAEHYERGGDRAGATIAYLRAAEQALEGNDLEAALSRADRGVASGATGELLGSLRLLQAHALRWQGRRTVALERAIEAAALLPSGSAPWFTAAGEMALALGVLGEMAQLKALYSATLVAPQLENAEVARLIAISQMVSHLVLGGERDEARAGLVELRAADEHLLEREPRVRAFIDCAHAWVAILDGNVEAHLELMLSCATADERLGDRRRAVHSRSAAGYAYAVLGAYDQAERHLRASLAEAASLGLAEIVAVGQHNLGLVVARTGRLDEGRDLERAALAVFDASAEARLTGGCCIYTGLIELWSGNTQDALTWGHRAMELLEPTPSSLRAYAGALLANARLAADPTTALELARRAMAQLEAAGSGDEGESHCRLVYARCLHAVGRLDEARTAIASARDRLLERASKITDASLRASFLERVSENADTLALARTWLDSPA